MAISAGWYPNPDGSDSQRYWDGTTWTADVAPRQQHPAAPAQHGPASGPAQPHPGYRPSPGVAPTGTSGSTVWIWIFALVPLLLLLSIAVFDARGYFEATMRAQTATTSADAAAVLDAIQASGYFWILLLGFLVNVASIICAVLDWMTLRRRGVPKPFGFGWVFLGTIVYIIGRTVVNVRRQVRGGVAPLVTWIVVGVVVNVVLFSVWFIQALDVVQQLNGSFTTS